LRFCGVHIGDHPPNQATTFESQQIQGIQYVFGQTLRPSRGHRSDLAVTQRRTEQLQRDLSAVRAGIEAYLLDYGLLENEGGRNRDPLSSVFILEAFQQAWCALRFGQTAPYGYGEKAFLKEQLPTNHHRPFAQFLATAWKDIGFPLVDHRGRSREPLEHWFADRLRKDKRFRNLPDEDLAANSIDI
jgi:hypothetical protein